MLVLAGGCAKEAGVPEDYDYDDYSEFITLADYKGIEYEGVDDQVSQEEVQAYIDEALASSAESSQNTEGVVTEDSVINIDYAGSIDGVEFDGGTAEGVELDIADNNYIDGFAEGIIGHKAGETFDLHVTFPENFGNDELNGREAVFSITINYIVEESIPEYNDEWVRNNTDYTTTAEYEEAVRSDILAGKSRSAQSEIRLEVFNKIMENTEVIKYPEKELNARYDDIVSSYQGYAEAADMEFEDYLNSEMGISVDEFESMATEAAQNDVKNEMVLRAIAQAEGIELTDSDYNEYLIGLLEAAGYTEDSYKEEKGYTIQEYAEENGLFTSYLYQRVMDKVMEYSVEKK